MSEATERVLSWSKKIENFCSAKWDRLPEIYLYMDQVLTYMNGQLYLFKRNESDALLTSSMINNYVKAGVLPRPAQKKYSRGHLAILTVVCLLKQVLSIQDISALVRTLLKNAPASEIYDRFCEAQIGALKEVCARVRSAASKGEAEMTRLAIELSVEANARRTAAERILSALEAADRRRGRRAVEAGRPAAVKRRTS